MATQASSLKYVEINGANLAYRESGQGEPMVLIHGHLSDYRVWTQLEARLSTKYHVYTYSRRFAWPNEPIKDGEGQPWEQDSLDLAGFIETLDIGPVHALGNSSGATIILYLAKTKPHLFRSLLVEEPPLITLFLPSLPPPPLSVLSFLIRHPISFWPVMIYGALTIGPATELTKQGKYDEALLTFGSGCLGPKYWPRAQADPERKTITENNMRWFCHSLRYNVLPKYTLEDAKNITVPTLVLTGADGPYFQQCIDAEFVRVCGARRKMEAKIPDAGHLMQEDNPEAVYEAIVKFLGEL
jgi:non-heme chloroperoxidase